MTRPIGDRFKITNHHPNMPDTVVVVEVTESDGTCDGCFCKGRCILDRRLKSCVGLCGDALRDDGKSVIFKKCVGFWCVASERRRARQARRFCFPSPTTTTSSHPESSCRSQWDRRIRKKDLHFFESFVCRGDSCSSRPWKRSDSDRWRIQDAGSRSRYCSYG